MRGDFFGDLYSLTIGMYIVSKRDDFEEDEKADYEERMQGAPKPSNWKFNALKTAI